MSVQGSAQCKHKRQKFKQRNTQTTKRKNFTWKTGDVPRGVNCQKYKGDLARKKGKLGVLPVGV